RGRPSALAAVFRRQDYLGHEVAAHAELFRDLRRAEPLGVVEDRQPLLRRSPARPRRLGGSWAWPRRARRLAGRRPRTGGRRRRTKRAPALVPVLPAGQIRAGVLVQDHELLGGLVLADRHHGHALEIALLAGRSGAVVVLQGPV